ncbi:MAG: dihydroorotate dehydrogenase-like protein [bacterium]|nr:MAG: dihydroorotate dehydrogenase-like protein [bacterium]
MADLSTNYLGLKLKNPIIIASSTLVQNLQGVREAEQAGAGAVVIRSLFEEVIREKEAKSGELYSGHPEEYEYIMSELNLEYGANYYLELIENIKSQLTVPVIASINCTTPKLWINYAKRIEMAGADALELNLSLMPMDPGKSSLDIEQEFLNIIKVARENTKLPLAVKLGPYITSLSRFANQICGSGVRSLVLFNRFYQFDIDVEKNEIIGANWYSTPAEMSLSLRWISILYKHINCELCATTGIHDSLGVIKQILAGSTAVQLASTIYLNGFSIVNTILQELNHWMDKNSYNQLDDFRGKLSLSQQKNPEHYERLQYIKALTGIEKRK